MSDEETLVSELALLVADGELSATAYFDVVDARAERLVERELHRLDEHATLRYLDVAVLLASVIGVLLAAGLAVALL